MSEQTQDNGDNGVDWKGEVDSARSKKVILLVTDVVNPSHGEIQEFSDPEAASREIETLLESGYDKDRIRVFTNESEVAVAYRPVVTLASTTGPLAGKLSENLPKVGSEEAA
ncbi:MAG: hypothetical protein DRI30_01320 [Chloroflexi bacterium]|nr:MAG: hypothetical protein DRI30_01320 [Chloroflexota bacterium]